MLQKIARNFLLLLLLFFFASVDCVLAEGKDYWSDLNTRIQLYRDKKEKPTFVIPFKELGPRLKAWQKDKRKGNLGYYAKQNANNIEVGFLPMGSDEIIEEDGVSIWDWIGTDKKASTTIYKSFSGRKISGFYNLAIGSMNLTTEIVTPLHGQAPQQDGSIIAFKTDGLKMIWLNFITLVSEGDDTLYFTVIDRLGGLVHIGGKGKFISRDNKETILK